MTAKRILLHQVLYRTSEPLKIGSEYYQVIARSPSSMGHQYEVGAYHGFLETMNLAKTPNDPATVEFSNDVAELYSCQSTTEAEESFKQMCDEFYRQGFKPYSPAIHGS